MNSEAHLVGMWLSPSLMSLEPSRWLNLHTYLVTMRYEMQSVGTQPPSSPSLSRMPCWIASHPCNNKAGESALCTPIPDVSKTWSYTTWRQGGGTNWCPTLTGKVSVGPSGEHPLERKQCKPVLYFLYQQRPFRKPDTYTIQSFLKLHLTRETTL